jgi:transposase
MAHRWGTSGSMARAYSQDLRERVIEAALSGPSFRQAAARFRVGVSTVIGWVGRLRDNGELSARRQGRPRGLKLEPHKDFLLPLIEDEPDMTIEKMQERLRRDRGVEASIGTIWTFLDRCKLSFKKKTAHASEQDRPDVLKQREDWFEGQLDLDPAKLVFIDETWASTNMAPLRGWAPKGERLRVGVPHGHVWTAPLVKGFLGVLRTSRVRSCLRPVRAGWRAAGLDGSSAWLFAPITGSRSIGRLPCAGLPSLSVGSHHPLVTLDL